MNKRKLYGLVVCGGQSSRMGRDKSMIEYHGMQQRYFAYRLLSNICEDVFLSCTDEQAKDIEDGYNILKDDEQFKDQGPLTALLTAFKMYPEIDFMVTGCDYPLLTLDDLLDFKKSIPVSVPAAAFYNPAENVYEPLLGYYSSSAGNKMLEKFNNGTFSLQKFLIEENACRYFPRDPKHTSSIDTPEQVADVLNILAHN